MSKPRLLDLFCGTGGSARGYQDAGFYVVGVDLVNQSNYCGDEFYHMDVLALEQDRLEGCWHENSTKSALPGMHQACLGHFDLIHASPPCQRYSDLAHRNGNGHEHPDLIGPTRELLEASGQPYVIENVEGAPLHDPVMLCGTMFPGLRVLRHRLFEASFPIAQPAHPDHPLVFTHDKRKAHYGKLDQDTAFVQVTGGGNATVANKRDAMGIDWMKGSELNEAIPPAYARYVGEQFKAEFDRLLVEKP